MQSAKYRVQNAGGGVMAENPLVMTLVVNRDGGVTPVMNLGQGGDVVGDLMMALRALGLVQDNLREALLVQVGRLEHEGAKGGEVVGD